MTDGESDSCLKDGITVQEMVREFVMESLAGEVVHLPSYRSCIAEPKFGISY